MLLVLIWIASICQLQIQEWQVRIPTHWTQPQSLSGHWSWIISTIWSSPPSTNSRRAIVSNWQKHLHKIKLIKKSVSSLTDQLDMTLKALTGSLGIPTQIKQEPCFSQRLCSHLLSDTGGIKLFFIIFQVTETSWHGFCFCEFWCGGKNWHT